MLSRARFINVYLNNKSEAKEAKGSEADEAAEGRDEQEARLASDKPVLPSWREVEKV